MNQRRYVDLRLSPEVVFGSGQAALAELHQIPWVSEELLWADPLTEEQTVALKFFAIAEFRSTPAIQDGEEMLAEVESLLDEIDTAMRG